MESAVLGFMLAILPLIAFMYTVFKDLNKSAQDLRDSVAKLNFTLSHVDEKLMQLSNEHLANTRRVNQMEAWLTKNTDYSPRS